VTSRSDFAPVVPRTIEAGGGLLWRRAGSGIELAVVHRPAYDDWSLPKGKLRKDERPIFGALREVHEETGHGAVPGRLIGEIHYLKDDVPKRVRYWAMRADDGQFVPSAEVDRIAWLPPREAAALMRPERDQHLIELAHLQTLDTWPCVLIRHGCAGDRDSTPGPDRDRPLDELGRAQAQALVPLLSAYRIQQLVTADVARCEQTIRPYADEQGLAIDHEPALSEDGYARHPGIALDRLLAIAAGGVAAAVCSQGGVLPEVIDALCTRLSGPRTDGTAEPDREPARDAANLARGGIDKAAMLVLHLGRGGNGAPTLVAAERYDPPKAG
jgi:8-oxo-dGTP diphosphatase